MDKEPSLRKKHQARDNNKGKNFLYTNKHVRLNESIRGGLVLPETPKNQTNPKPCSKIN